MALVCTVGAAHAFKPIMVGHKGCVMGVENTHDAIVNAVKVYGYDYVECDMMTSSDQQIIICHDANLQNFGHNVTISSKTAAELKALTLTQTRYGKTYTGHLMDINEFCALVDSLGVSPIIEIKGSGGLYLSSMGNFSKVYAAIEANNLLDKAIILSDYTESSEWIRTNYPNIKVQQLYSNTFETDFEAKLAWCKKWGCDASVSCSYINADRVQQFHDAGLNVGAWTVDNPTTANTMASYGCFMITTDSLRAGVVNDIPDPFVVRASDLSDLKIYINPGHGGWCEVNDRHIPTMPFPQYDADQHWDTLGFWESSSNLKVAQDLREILLAAGVPAQNIKLSRETNNAGPRDIGELSWDLHRLTAEEVDSAEGDRTFAAIKAEAAEMEPDLLLSIHSNAANYIGAAANFVSAYLEGNASSSADGSDGKQYAASATAYDYAKTLVKWQLDPLDCYHEVQTTGYIHSFNNNWSLLSSKEGVACYDPTVLVEASFHSYLPNTHRFLNRDYQKEEAYRFFMALNELFGDGGCPTTGVICGDVRSMKEKAEVGSWNPKTDAYPANPDGFGLIITGKDQYMPINGALVELLNGEEVVQTYTTDNYHNGLYFFFDVAPGLYTVRVTKERYLVTEQSVYVGAKPSNNIATINFRMPFTQEEDQRQQRYEDGDLGTLDGLITANALTIRRALSHGQYLFVLALKTDNTPYLYRVNKRGTVVQQYNTSDCAVVSGRVLGDIALSDDGVLYGCNDETYLDGTTEYNTPNLIYRWDKDGTMTVLFENKGVQYRNTANWLIGDTGESMTVVGNSSNGKIAITSENVSPTSGKRYQMRWLMFEMEYGDVMKCNIQKPQGENIKTSDMGAQYQLHAYKDDIILSGSTKNHYQLTIPSGVHDATTTLVCTRTDLNGVINFTIGQHANTLSMFVPTAVGIDIYDISSSFTSTTKQSVAFEGDYDGGFMSAGTFAGDTLWLIRNNHLQILPEMTEDPTGLIEAQRGHANATKVMQNGVMYIIREGRKYDMQGSIVK